MSIEPGHLLIENRCSDGDQRRASLAEVTVEFDREAEDKWNSYCGGQAATSRVGHVVTNPGDPSGQSYAWVASARRKGTDRTDTE